MYTLILTASERQAIDHIGDRYDHGHRLYQLLWCSDTFVTGIEWDSEEDITFSIPEYIAWEIREIGEACEYRWDCFAPELANKLTEFCNRII